MAFRKYFLDHKLFWGFASSFVAILAVFKFVYGPWTQRASLNANIFYDMEPKMKWIVKAQEKYKKRSGTYTEDLKELIKEGYDLEPKRAALDLAVQVEKYKSNPGMTYAKSHSGPKYYIEIKAADADNFLAEASYMGFASHGEDIWQIDKTGTIVNKVKSQIILDADKYHWRDRILSWWLLGSIILFLWGLGEKTYRFINGKIPRQETESGQ